MKALGFTVAAALTPLMASGAQAAGTLTGAVAIDPGSWDPIDTFLVDWSSAANNIYDGLTARGPDMKLKPRSRRRGSFSTATAASASSCARTSSSTTASPSTRRP
jgi:hypothetical protein